MRVAIADDHALFRQGLKSMLRLQPDLDVVAELDRADALLSTLERTPCDILLLDLQMERSAFVDIEQLAERVAIIVVTATERAEDAIAALRAGARGLVFKRFALETLMTAIRTVMDGHVWLPPELQSEITARLHSLTETSLTPREREIVRHVALEPRAAGPIHHGAATNHEIVHAFLLDRIRANRACLDSAAWRKYPNVPTDRRQESGGFCAR